MAYLLYLAAIVLALPCTAFALGLLVLGHVVATKNPFVLFYHFILAFSWGLPALLLATPLVLVAGLFPWGRVVGAGLLILLDLVALVLIVASPASPRSVTEALFLAPAIVSGLLAGHLVLSHIRSHSTLQGAPKAVAGAPRGAA